MKLLRTFVAIGFLTSLFLGCSGSSSSSSDDEDSISSSDAEGASDEKSSSSGKSKGNSSGTSGQNSSNSSSKSSSSAAPALVSPCRANGVDTCVYGILTDKRDGHSYKTVVIGTQVWMAENLNYEAADALNFCFFANDCEKIGRHYEWSSAVDSVNTGNGSTEATCPKKLPVKGVCPDGWHIPSRDEWETLNDNVGRDESNINLRASEEWDGGWYTFSDKRQDPYGFSVLQTMKANTANLHPYAMAAYWLVDPDTCGINYTYIFSTGNAHASHITKVSAGQAPGYERFANSIRCLRDEPYTGTVENDPVSTTTHKPHTIEYYLNPDKTYGEFTDERDGKVYKTLEIDGQTWMVQNLSYETPDGRSSCFEDDEKICDVFGRIYPWTTVVDSAGRKMTGDTPTRGYEIIQGICPDGWHVPSQNEWLTLLVPAASDTVQRSSEIRLMDAAPRFMSNKMWMQGPTHTDEFGFSILPAFNRDSAIYLSSLGGIGFNDVGHCFAAIFRSDVDQSNVVWAGAVEKPGFVRCIKDGSAVRYPAEAEALEPCNLNGVDNCQYGTLTDKRDGRTYKTVTIGEQEWMAENLRYIDSDISPNLTICKDSLEENCEKYGRLYRWGVAIDSKSLTEDQRKLCGNYGCTLERNHQGICPDGWRLPNLVDFEILDRSTNISPEKNSSNAVSLASATAWNDTLLRPDSLNANLYGLNIVPTEWENSPMEARASSDIWSSSVGDYGHYASGGGQGHPFIYARFANGGKENGNVLIWYIWGDGDSQDYKAVRCIKE